MNTDLKLPVISSDANKYTRGSLLVLAGSRRYFGAGVLATLAAEKTGAGYVSLATPKSSAFAARQHLLCSPVIEAAEDAVLGCFTATALPDILQEFRRINALCAGPGLTVNDNTASFLRELLRHALQERTPLLLDADALSILAAKPELMSRLQRERQNHELDVEQQMQLILTPHEGELARMHNALFPAPRFEGEAPWPATKLKVPVSQAAQELAMELGAVIVAKGPTTYITSGGELVECNKATPALAKAGTGDVLSGVISSLLAQGMRAFEAAALGVEIHSLAGVAAEQKQGRRSVTALDVVEAIPQVVSSFEG